MTNYLGGSSPEALHRSDDTDAARINYLKVQRAGQEVLALLLSIKKAAIGGLLGNQSSEPISG